MRTADSLDLVLFSTDPGLISQALASGLTALIVDWEWRDKEERQQRADTEINRDTVEDLARLRELCVPRRFCRLNRLGPWTGEEVEHAVSAGATDVFLPMVESPREVDEIARLVDERCRLGILVETLPGVERAPELARTPVDFVYIGLNDLAISRGSASIFDAVVDGTVERLRDLFRDVAFGFGGVTVAHLGKPIPCRLLVAEMARLGCAFSFLRRSFKRDIVGRNFAVEIARIQTVWRRLVKRPAEEIFEDKEALATAVHGDRRRLAL